MCSARPPHARRFRREDWSMTLPFAEYDALDGLALADLVRRREVSEAQMTEAALARMAARNLASNAGMRPHEQHTRRRGLTHLR
jgi:hypothetical protein